MTRPKMVMYAFRIPVGLREAAKAKAAEREENLSDVLREALERYAEAPTPHALQIDPCPVCGGMVTRLSVYDGTTTATDCGHRVAATIWPDRVELVKPPAP